MYRFESSQNVGHQMSTEILSRVKQAGSVIGVGFIVVVIALVLYGYYGIDHQKNGSQELWDDFYDVHGEFVIHYNNAVGTRNKTEAKKHYQSAQRVITMWHPSGNVHPEFLAAVQDWKTHARDLIDYRLQKLDNWIGGNAGDDETDRLLEAQEKAARAVSSKFLELYLD
ncbi:MAG: hypothetical protein ACPGYV_01025 [Phycisphaeraceae bacterium]